MRRTPLLGVLACAVVTALTGGCGGSDTAAKAGAKPAGDIELVYAYDALFTHALRDIASGVEKQDGIETKLLLAGESYEDANKRIQTDIAAGNPPALAMVGLNGVRQYVDAGVATPIDDLIDHDASFKAGDLYPQFASLLDFDGKTYGLPFAVSTPVLYYNADAFRKAGLDPEDPPETWSEIRQAAQQIVSRHAARHGVYWDWGLTGNWLFENQVESNGGKVADDSGAPAFNSPQGVEVADYWRGLVHDDLMPLVDEKEGVEAFTRGDVGMMVSTTGFLGTIEGGAKFDVRTGVMPIPDDGQRITSAGGNGFIILAKDPAQRAAAWEMLKALVSPQGSATVTAGTGYMPVSKKGVDTLPAFDQLLEDPNRRTSLKQIETLNGWNNWPGIHQVEIAETLNDSLFQVLSGKQPAQQALDGAAEQVSSLATR